MNNLIYQYFIPNYNTQIFSKETINQCIEIKNYSWTSVKKYCKKYNIDLLQTSESYYDPTKFDIKKNLIPYFDILRIIYDPYFDSFENILYLDSDIIINKYAPNIFNNINLKEHYHVATTGNIIDFTPTCKKRNVKKISGPVNIIKYKKLLNLYKKFEVNLPKHDYIASINSGVVLFTKKGRQEAREKFEHWTLWAKECTDEEYWMYADQHYLDAMIRKYLNNLYIDEKWNYILSYYKTEYWREGFFIHLTYLKENKLINKFIIQCLL